MVGHAAIALLLVESFRPGREANRLAGKLVEGLPEKLGQADRNAITQVLPLAFSTGAMPL